MSKNGMLLTFVLILAGLSIYFWESPVELISKVREDDGKPYAIVRNTSTRYFNPLGQLDYTFKARKLEYFQGYSPAPTGEDVKNNYTLMTEPKIAIFHEGEPWLAQARQGKFTEQNKLLLLWDNVVVTYTSIEGITATLQTEALEIKPVEKYAQTKEAVKITSPSGELAAIGMIVNLAEEQVTLLSSVKGSYEPM